MSRAAAAYEAGHAVVGRAVGFGVALVTLERNPAGAAGAWTIAARGSDPYPAPGSLVSLSRPLALRSAIYSLAGPAAEARASHRSIVATLAGPPAARDVGAVQTEIADVADRARAMEGARLLVITWCPTIRRVADALLVERTLDGAALSALLPTDLRTRGPGVVPAELPPALACRLWEPSPWPPAWQPSCALSPSPVRCSPAGLRPRWRHTGVGSGIDPLPSSEIAEGGKDATPDRSCPGSDRDRARANVGDRPAT